MKPRFSNRAVILALITFGIAVGAVLLKSQPTEMKERQARQAPAASTQTSVELSPSQLNAVRIEPVGSHPFSIDRQTVGSISFADDLSVQVFPPFQGKVIRALVELGDHVQKGQSLYTVDSPDLIQAESSLISTAGVFELTSKELARAKKLNHSSGGVSERELEQATSDQQTAEGALKAARDAVRVFGKSDAEIDQIIASRKVDPALIVRSPISGQITSFNAPPGLFVQPGNGMAPYTVTDVSVKWMLASIIESDIAQYQLGQPVAVTVAAYPNRVFQGRISKVYASVDPATHRATIRSQIADPTNEMRPGMLANFTIQVQKPMESIAVPANGVVREGDGTMTAWVTSDRRRFSQRVIKTGLRSGNWVQVLEGLQRGELVVSDGAVFLSNMLNTP
ncbi:MAG: efflux RND transporter periplasmic adaptor subunit, partial [Acidobacteria bacterium]|nr:efflux RND transporter periplasmic adaptor subunit [Acidobacteriota bacterium]